VLDALGCARRTRGVHEEKHVLGVAFDGFDRVTFAARFVASEPTDDHPRRVVGHAAVRLLFVVEFFAAAVVRVTRHEVFRGGVFHPCPECVGAESREHDVVWRTDPGARQHGDGEFGHHRHVHRDDVVFLDADGAQTRRERLYLL
jgi:hypothetical protein